LLDVLPDTRLITGTQYTGEVIWFAKSGSSTIAITGNDGKFAINTEYVARATLTANPGYTFAGLANNSFTYGGAATVVTNAVSGVINITFPALGRAWYVANYGTDSLTPATNGTSSETPFKTVNYALAAIVTAHATPHSTWTNADIVVIGTSGDTRTIRIDNTTNIYPPITLRGLSPTQPGILTADKAPAVAAPPTPGWTNPSGTITNPLATNAYRVLEITGGATVTLGNDLIITGGGQRGYVQLGAGVYVHDNGITNPFTMNGGTITGNKAHTTGDGKGGGVYVNNTSVFIMNGGVISNNYAFHTGGVAIDNSSTFTMIGGTITNNECEHGGGGVRANYASTFTMSGGVISGNKVTAGYGGGIYSYMGSIIMNGGTVSGNTALACGGVDIDSTATFVMNGGSITDNTATGKYFGGGVGVLDNASFTMHGGTISGNTAPQGGGVAVTGGTFKKEPLVSGGASGIIYGSNGGDNSNTATSAAVLLQDLGHAVYIAPEAGGLKTRETTVLPDQLLNSAVADGWID
jgi:hypothetical protein